MLEAEILADQEGLLWLGPRGERLYGRRNFGELYAVFDTPRLITALWDTRELGTIDANFLQSLGDDKGPASFTLAGAAVAVSRGSSGPAASATCIPAERRRLEPAGAARPATSATLSARRSASVLISRRPSTRLHEGPRRLRSSPPGPPIPPRRPRTPRPPKDPRRPHLVELRRRRANILLAQLLEHELGGKVTARDLSLTCREEAGKSEPRLRQLLHDLQAHHRPTAQDARTHAPTAARTRLSKFEPCLPDPLLTNLLATRSLDPEAARSALSPDSDQSAH
jgi:ATP-dependent Lhr-like helicase